jgi:hypothetical protein
MDLLPSPLAAGNVSVEIYASGAHRADELYRTFLANFREHPLAAIPARWNRKSETSSHGFADGGERFEHNMT